jgi:hypothetical protein
MIISWRYYVRVSDIICGLLTMNSLRGSFDNNLFVTCFGGRDLLSDSSLILHLPKRKKEKSHNNSNAYFLQYLLKITSEFRINGTIWDCERLLEILQQHVGLKSVYSIPTERSVARCARIKHEPVSTGTSWVQFPVPWEICCSLRKNKAWTSLHWNKPGPIPSALRDLLLYAQV